MFSVRQWLLYVKKAEWREDRIASNAEVKTHAIILTPPFPHFISDSLVYNNRLHPETNIRLLPQILYGFNSWVTI